MKNQTLSALIDGELNPDEMEAALDSVLADPQLQTSWYHLHTVRSVIRGDAQPVSSDMVARLADALENEPVILAPENLKLKKRARPSQENNVVQIGAWRNKALAYTAIAASFAAIILVSYSPQEMGESSLAGSSDAPVRSQAVEQELQSMVVQHGEFSGAAALNGLVAYAKVVNGSTAPGSR